MSYPPQPPGGGTGPHGMPAQPWGSQPQQPASGPQQRPFTPVPPGYGPFGPPTPGATPPYGAPPPRRRGLIVSIAAAVLLVIAAVLVTGLVSPGWMLPEEKSDTAQAGPQTVLRTVVDAMNSRDIPTIKQRLCPGAQAAAITEPIPQGTRIAIGSNPTPTSPQSSATITASLPGAGTLSFRVQFRLTGSAWCVQRVRGIAH